MGRILVLPADVRGKIAAGEVITRPNSIVKELIENALDAVPTRIEIEIEDGGKKKCLVNDDGSGMSRDDALLSIERFTTSKISSLTDIENIRTYGFRGEALASIAQVCGVEIETSDGREGTRIEIMGGEVKAVHESHRRRGTRVKVTDLFYNLPVRLKFLKSSDWERRLIVDTVKSYSLVHPTVGFSLTESGRTLLIMGSAQSVQERIAFLFGYLQDTMVRVTADIDAFSLSAFISKPDSVEKRSVNHIFVNGRPVKYPRIYRTVLEAYQNPQNTPSFILFIVADPAFVDVNIHPAKSEVKFRDERYVADVLLQAIRKKLQTHTLAPGYVPGDGAAAISLDKKYVRIVQDNLIPYETTEQQVSALLREPAEFWQIHSMYILAQTKTGMIIVDQHVAHERILYEALISGKVASQRLLFPITLALTPDEYEVYAKTKDLLNDLGIEFKEFSERTVVIDSIPADARISREDLTDFFSEIGGLGSLMKEKLEVAKIVACKSAVKAGQKLSLIEMQTLIDRLFACENPYTCPHGRPIVLKFSLDELAKKFGR
jgi:DNA mismatch repair protein MutL